LTCIAESVVHTEYVLASPHHSPEITIRRELRDSDGQRIAELHRRIYGPEFARNEWFVTSVASSVESAIERGWPAAGGAVWLIDGERELRGCLALTDEGEGVGRARWFVLDPALRGHGLGRALVANMVDHARASGMTRIELETFSALRAAAHLYREAGFRLLWERERSDWGPTVTYQGYELQLR
jgi:GNAT superfamily N-acetyltransferase